MNAPDVRKQLAKVGAERVEAYERAQSASTKLAAFVGHALEQGMTKSEISRLAQISRPALDAMLKQPPERQPCPTVTSSTSCSAPTARAGRKADARAGVA